MKKITLLITFLLFFLLSFSHTLTNDCWINGHYNMIATLGDNNGKIEVTVYTNSTRTVLVQSTQTYSLSSNGSVSFQVLQPIRITPVFVYVRWFDKQGNNYIPTTWNSGQGYPNSYSSKTTGTNQCTTVAIDYGYYIKYQVIQGKINLYWETSDYDSVELEYSKDGLIFDKFTVILDNQLHTLSYTPSNFKNYFRVRFKKPVGEKLSNIISVDFTQKGIDYSKPYRLCIYDYSGKLIKVVTRETQYKLSLKGYYTLKYIQQQGDLYITESVNQYF